VIARYIAFLKACTLVALEIASRSELSDDFFEKFFSNQVHNNRDKFWTEIIGYAKDFERKINTSKCDPEKDKYLHEFVRSHRYDPLNLLSLTNLSCKPLKMLFVLDEVHCLFGQEKINKDLFVNFVRALQIFDAVKGVICATADTISKLSKVMPVDKDHGSDRIFSKVFERLPPFYRIGTIDCYVDVEGESYHSLDEIVEKKRITRYGRPLWWSLVNSGEQLDYIIMLAKKKLLGLDSAVQLTTGKFTFESCLAILSSRLQFAERPSFSIASELAASHLAIVDYISKGKDVLFISYASEPIVAEAAALLMKENIVHILRKMESYFKDQFIDRGIRSEYIARLVCLLAADKISSSISTNPAEYKYNRIISCEEYLAQLVGADLKKIISDQTQSIEGVDFRRFKKGKIFLTHFITCNYVPTVGDLTSFFERGAGILCKTNQSGVDMIIPVVLPPVSDAKFNPPSDKVSEAKFKKNCRKTTAHLDLSGKAKIPHHDEYDIPETLQSSPSSTMNAQTSRKTVSALKPVTPDTPASLKKIINVVDKQEISGSPLLASRIDVPESSAGNQLAISPSIAGNGPIILPENETEGNFEKVLVAPANMSYILIQVFHYPLVMWVSLLG
jgi:hypothetical protein